MNTLGNIHGRLSTLCRISAAVFSVTALLSGCFIEQLSLSKPTDLIAQPLSDKQIALSWQDNSANEKGFKVHRSGIEEGGYEVITVLPANTSGYIDEPLNPDTTYTYQVMSFSEEESQYSNEASATTYSSVPEVILVPATVSGFTPGNGENNVPVNSSISITFSDSMNPDTINKMSFIVNGTDGPVSGNVYYDEALLTAFFVPTASLRPGSLYTARVSEAVESKTGVPLSADCEWAFLTMHQINTGFDAIQALITGNTYYLDAMNGNDITGDGSSGSPWKSLAKAKSIVKSGDGVMLRSGNYGDYIEKSASGRSNWIVYMCEKGEKPVFTSINLYYDSPTNAYLVFYGIDITVSWVDPASSGNTGASDPYYTNSDGNTYAKTADPVSLWKANYVQVHQCSMLGTNRNLTEHGVWMQHVSDILIEGNDIRRCVAMVQFQDAKNVIVRNNYMHEMSASCIREGNGNIINTLIEGNHGYDSNYNLSEAYVPKGTNKNYHGSAIALRAGDVRIRNNVFHYGWNSSGIMFYDDMGTLVFSDVIVENNCMYDIGTHIFRIYRLGKNVVLRNNTFIGYWRDHSCAPYNYYTAFSIEQNGGVADGYDASGLSLYNNIFVGAANFSNHLPDVKEDCNIFWAVSNTPNVWIDSSKLSSRSEIITTSKFIDYFENGFFSGEMITTRGHGALRDYSLKKGSPAINFGDVLRQTSDSLGKISAYGFIEAGCERDINHHSAGAYEYAQ